MLAYLKRQDIDRVIPYTDNRYKVVGEMDVLFDSYIDKAIEPKDGCYDLKGSCLGKVSFEELWMLANKPLNIDPFDFKNAWLDSKIAIVKTSDPFPGKYSTFWKFRIQSSYYPGFFYIPGFTSYLIDRNGNVLSRHTGQYAETYVANNGYPTLRMVRDDGKTKLCALHVLLGLTFIDYGSDILSTAIDHVDGNKENYDLDNLDRVTHAENNRRASESNYYGKGKFSSSGNTRIYFEDIETKETGVYRTIESLAKHLGMNNSTLSNHLAKAFQNGLVKSRYIIVYCEVDNEGNPLLDAIKYDELRKREGSQPRPVLEKNFNTGIEKRFSSVVQYIKHSGLTRKQVYGNLANSNQKIFGEIIFKYEDDETPWVR